MSLLKPMDEKFPIERQLAVEAAPVVLINLFALDAADETRFLEVWKPSRHESGGSVRHLRTYSDHAARMEVSRRSGLRSELSVGVQM